MKQLFFNTIQSINQHIPKKIIEYHWQNLINHYQQPHRFYHNFSHIQVLIKHFLANQSHFSQPNHVLLAIFYHDVIYQTDIQQNISNEQQSADFLLNCWQTLIDKSVLEPAIILILATEKHQLPINIDKNLSNDIALFLDMDLSILGSSPNIYQQYAQQIRQEYVHIPDLMYRQGRSQILQHFLIRPRLYFSESFFQQYEQLARQNIINEINSLSFG